MAKKLDLYLYRWGGSRWGVAVIVDEGKDVGLNYSCDESDRHYYVRQVREMAEGCKKQSGYEPRIWVRAPKHPVLENSKPLNDKERAHILKEIGMPDLFVLS